MTYHPHEIKRHIVSIKETLERACQSVFTEPKMSFRVKDRSWWLAGPGARVTISVFRSAGCCRGQPVCALEIARPKTKEGLFEYGKASAVFLDPQEHAGSTRLIGHLRRHCPFLPEIEVTMSYDLSSAPGA
jgi:hypothetical protein